MSDAKLKNLDAVRDEARSARALEDLAEGDVPMGRFTTGAAESPGFKLLESRGAQLIQAFKLLELSLSTIGGEEGTSELTTSEWALLQRMLGEDFAKVAAEAYKECKSRTRRLEDMHALDNRVVCRLTEFIHLFENTMLWGSRTGRLRREQAPRVLDILVRDFGEYFGLLIDDMGDSQASNIKRIADYLSHFKGSELYREKMPIDEMTRMPLGDPKARALLRYEIARGITPHPLSVKECTIRELDSEEPVSFVSHKLSVRYALDLRGDDINIINAILPIFAVSFFEGLSSLPEAEEYIAKQQREIRLHEQQCFAMLQCLKHFDGDVPSQMREIDVRKMQQAAQRAYRERAKASMDTSATTIRGMLKEKVSGVFQAVSKPVSFDWPESRAMYTLPGHSESTRFFPLEITIGVGAAQDRYTFLVHTDLNDDPDAESPKIFEYQIVLEDGLLFDAHAACRDGFVAAPGAFKATLNAGPVVLFAKEVVHPGELEPSVDIEETKLLGTYVALRGGMQSWLGQSYVLSQAHADIFTSYEDVRAYVKKSAG